MTNNDFKLTLVSSQTPEQVFQAILNTRAWWSGFYNEHFTGNTDKLNEEFVFRAGDGAHYSKQKLVELAPNQRVVWLITEGELTFVDKTDEWVGTRVIFAISTSGDKTILEFTHEGLTPEVECYTSCAPGWTTYLQNKLAPMIEASVQVADTK